MVLDCKSNTTEARNPTQLMFLWRHDLFDCKSSPTVVLKIEIMAQQKF
jgi:hypothetical protein